MSSMTEVARRAGVSVATVSRLVNGTSPVDPAKAERIRACMRELGFDPRKSARGPRGGAGRPALRNVLLLSPGELRPADLLRMPAFPALAAGMHQAAEAEGFNLMLSHSPDGAVVPAALAAGQVDGVVVVGRESSPLGPGLLQALDRVAVVGTLRGHDDLAWGFDAVAYDNRAVGPLAARHFAERGVRRAACVSMIASHRAYSRRVAGFVEACREAGIEVECLHSPLDSAREAAAEAAGMAARAIAEAEPDLRPQAIFCVSDDLMLEVSEALARRGVRVPGDVDLLGCNNDPEFLAAIRPRPATIDIMLGEVGRRTIEQLRWRMAHPDRPRVDILVKPVVRPGAGA